MFVIMHFIIPSIQNILKPRSLWLEGCWWLSQWHSLKHSLRSLDSGLPLLSPWDTAAAHQVHLGCPRHIRPPLARLAGLLPAAGAAFGTNENDEWSNENDVRIQEPKGLRGGTVFIVFHWSVGWGYIDFNCPWSIHHVAQNVQDLRPLNMCHS